MSNKGESCLTFVLTWSFIIILFVTVFLCGFSFIYYSEKISLDSKVSSFFSFVSSLGILSTIGVYIHQKNREDRMQKNKDDIVKRYIILDIKGHLKTISDIKKFLDSEYRTHYKEIELDYNDNIGYMLTAKDGDGDLVYSDRIRTNNREFIKEAMNLRHLTSDKVIQLTEEMNYISDDFEKSFQSYILSTLKSNTQPIKMKLLFLDGFSVKFQEFIDDVNKIKDKL